MKYSFFARPTDQTTTGVFAAEEQKFTRRAFGRHLGGASLAATLLADADAVVEPPLPSEPGGPSDPSLFPEPCDHEWGAWEYVDPGVGWHPPLELPPAAFYKRTCTLCGIEDYREPDPITGL
jgi:hypothetical protein